MNDKQHSMHFFAFEHILKSVEHQKDIKVLIRFGNGNGNGLV